MRMANNFSSLFFWFTLITIIGVVSSQVCIEDGIFDPTGDYNTNREKVLLSLVSNVTANSGYYRESSGQSPDQVYAAGMCIAETEPSVCSECIKVAAYQLIENCPNQNEAFTWTSHKTLCFARYSNVSFFGNPSSHPYFTDLSSVDIKPNATFFNTIWEGLTKGLEIDASSRNDTSSPNETSLSSSKYYATTVTNLTSFQSMHASMVCTPDISNAQCLTCLGDVVTKVENNRSQGGITALPSCCFRWNIYPFSGAFSLAPPHDKGGSAPPAGKECPKHISTGMIVVIVLATGVFFSILTAVVAVFVCRTDPPNEKNPLQYDLKTIIAATCTFAKSNMVGRGGFGEVFKGVLEDGSEIAVKRLSTESRQGVQEFKNETSLVSKLQHRNLVSVLGFCVEGDEKILVYEFVANKSLDHFLFEPRQGQLDWAKRYEIILGTAKGIQYLHYDSPLKIIHRDLKASNILLDAEMKPKVADFGMARILELDQSRADTSRVVGTHGYISPEYMMHGQYSMKSDVYSFGVLVLEIISGKRNSNFHENDSSSGKNLVMHAWKHWRDGSPLVIVDAEMGTNYQSNEVIRCIHIALLCVQNVPEKRPYISSVISMLTGDSTSLPVPESPVYRGSDMPLPIITSVPVSANDSLINDLVPR